MYALSYLASVRWPTNRAYADVFLKCGVALIGPGDSGPWRPDRDDDDANADGSSVRRFATEVQKTFEVSETSKVSDETLKTRREATTLDRVHAAMLLQQSGRANALRALLKAEQERGPNFFRLANSLSALYPRESEERRFLDAMLLAVPR